MVLKPGIAAERGVDGLADGREVGRDPDEGEQVQDTRLGTRSELNHGQGCQKKGDESVIREHGWKAKQMSSKSNKL